MLVQEFWKKVFGKIVDKLQTNVGHSKDPMKQGTYVLHDNKFKWLRHWSPPPNAEGSSADSPQVQLYCAFACGVLRGGLRGLGMQAQVTCKVEAEGALPRCEFTILEVTQGARKK